MEKALDSINQKIDFLIIGEKATSYRHPLIVNYIKNYHPENGEDMICIETKNITGKYIVFDRVSFLSAIEKYNKGDNNNGNNNNKEP